MKSLIALAVTTLISTAAFAQAAKQPENVGTKPATPAEKKAEPAKKQNLLRNQQRKKKKVQNTQVTRYKTRCLLISRKR